MAMDVLINAAIKTNNFFSDGFVHISGNSIEGIFTLDYAKLELKNNQLILHLCIHTNKVDVNELTSELSNFRNTVEYSTYRCSYNDSTLYAPDTYLLSDNNGNFLFLSLLDLEKDPSIIKRKLDFIKNHKESI